MLNKKHAEDLDSTLQITALFLWMYVCVCWPYLFLESTGGGRGAIQ